MSAMRVLRNFWCADFDPAIIRGEPPCELSKVWVAASFSLKLGLGCVMGCVASTKALQGRFLPVAIWTTGMVSVGSCLSYELLMWTTVNCDQLSAEYTKKNIANELPPSSVPSIIGKAEMRKLDKDRKIFCSGRFYGELASPWIQWSPWLLIQRASLGPVVLGFGSMATLGSLLPTIQIFNRALNCSRGVNEIMQTVSFGMLMGNMCLRCYGYRSWYVYEV